MLAHGANPSRGPFWRAASAGIDEPVPFASGPPAEVGASLDAWPERIRAPSGAACVHVGAAAELREL